MQHDCSITVTSYISVTGFKRDKLLPVILRIDSEMLDPIIDDSLSGLEVTGDGGGNTSLPFQGINDDLPLEGFDHGLQAGTGFRKQCGIGCITGLK